MISDNHSIDNGNMTADLYQFKLAMRMILAGVLSGGVFFLQLGLTVFSVRQTFKMLSPEADPHSPTEVAITTLAGLSTAYVLFFTFYLSTYFKLGTYFANTEPVILENHGNTEINNSMRLLPRPLKYLSNFTLSVELVNLFFSSYLVTAEVSEIDSKSTLYGLMIYPFLSNCVVFYLFTCDIALKNIHYLHHQFQTGTYHGKKMAYSALTTGLATASQAIAINYFFQNALKQFPPTNTVSNELATGLSATITVLYIPFSAVLGLIQMYRYFTGEENYSASTDIVLLNNVQFRSLMLTHHMMQFLYILGRSFITFASTLSLIARLDTHQLSTPVRAVCAVPVVCSYAAYEYFFLCRTGTQLAKKLNNRYGFFRQINHVNEDNPQELHLLAHSPPN